MEAVWRQYINDYHEAPSNAFKLVNYSRHHNELRTLSYSEAKKVIDKYTNTLKNPCNDIQKANSLMIGQQNTRQRARSHNDHDNESDDDPPVPSRDYKRRRSHHHSRNGSKFDRNRQIKRHPRRHSNDLNDRKYRKMKQTKKNIISFKEPKPKRTTSPNQQSSSGSGSSSSKSSSDSSDDDRKQFEKMTKKKPSKRRKSERINRTNSAKNIFGFIKSKKASTPTHSNSNHHNNVIRPGSAKNMHMEHMQKHRSLGDEDDNNEIILHSKSLHIQNSSTSPARSKWKPKKIKSANVIPQKQVKPRKRKKPRRLKKPKLPSNSYYCGDHVMLAQNREGIILYIGEVHFAKGIWVGLELVNGAVGAHDGVVDKQRYFQTAPNRGIFVKESHIKHKVDTTPNVSKRSYSMDLNDPNFAKAQKEKAKLGLMHPLEPSKSYSNGSDHSPSMTPSNHSAQSVHSHNHLDVVLDDREDSRPLSTKSMNAASVSDVGSSNYDIMEFKEMVRAEVESEFQAKFDEFKKMMIKESKHSKHSHRRKKKKHRKDKKKRKRAKSKRRKDKKQLSKLKKMEKRRKDRSKSRGMKLKSSEDEIKSNNNEHVKSVSLNIEIQDFDPDEVEQVTAESEEYRKNSDLNVNEEEFAFESDDDEEDGDIVGNDNLDPIGLSLNVKSSNADGDEMRSPSNIMSDFDEKDIGYTNQLVQGTNNGKGGGLGSNFKFKLW